MVNDRSLPGWPAAVRSLCSGSQGPACRAGPGASAAPIPLCSTQAGNCRLSTTAMGAACSSVGTSNPITMSQGRDQDSNAPIYIFILPITPSSTDRCPCYQDRRWRQHWLAAVSAYRRESMIAYDIPVAISSDENRGATAPAGLRALAPGRVAVIAEPDASVAALARELGLPTTDAAGARCFAYVLARTPERLELRDNRSRRARPIYVDVSAVCTRYNRKTLSRGQPLVRAMGARTRSVFDVTAGLGQDALLLACLGYKVTAIERSPVIAALLRDGVARAHQNSQSRLALGGRLTVITADARDVLPTIYPRPDVVYMDPMFPPKRKRSALAKNRCGYCAIWSGTMRTLWSCSKSVGGTPLIEWWSSARIMCHLCSRIRPPATKVNWCATMSTSPTAEIVTSEHGSSE